MSDDTDGFSVLAFIVLFLFFVLGLFMGSFSGYHDCQREAVRQNVAHYEQDKDGSSVFVWNTPLEKVETKK